MDRGDATFDIPDADLELLRNGYPDEDKAELLHLIERSAELKRQLRDTVRRGHQLCDNLEQQ